jgi:hypothetical protein
MELQLRPDDMPLRQARQFSVRELLVLTLATSLILAIGVSSRGSTYFGAFSSVWALAALSPVVGVLIVVRFRLTSSRALAIGSIVLYGASLCSPAVGIQVMSSPSTIWGFQAIYLSVWILAAGMQDLLQHGSFGDALEAAVYVMSIAANIAFVLSAIFFFIGIKQSKTLTTCWRVSLLGAVLGIAVLAVFLLDGDIKVIYPGYGLWISSLLAMALAAKRARSLA